MKLTHITDTHLDFLGDRELYRKIDKKEWIISNVDAVAEFAYNVCMSQTDSEYVVLTGDISTGNLFRFHLETMANVFRTQNKKLLFVCGNHDFYHSSFAKVNEEISKLLTEFKDNLFFLTRKSFAAKEHETVFVGHDGWYDGLYSSFNGSVVMNDYYIIEEFCRTGKVFDYCRDLATKAAKHVTMEIDYMVAAHNPKNVVVATHVPPFRENSTHNGKVSNHEWLPCFSSKTMGDALRKSARKHPGVKFTVLCGHTHDAVCHVDSPNLRCYTGHSQYGNPGSSVTHLEI
jgi:predicted phosphohydrolase